MAQLIAYREIGRNLRHRRRDLCRPDSLVDHHAGHLYRWRSRVGLHVQRKVPGGLSHCVKVLEVDSLLSAPPRQSAVHRAGVEIGQVEALRDRPGDAGLARSRWAVDGDDKGLGSLRSPLDPICRLLVDRPAQSAQGRDQGLGGSREHRQLDEAERLAHAVLQVQVLHVDSGLTDITQEPTQCTRLVGD